ncbi:hypothetical protein HMPREF9413_2142 [Paenibacillus sp. HGF7]|nr:hypothetical protein HMPREF9413_2142 [Paenibacillus sp. HGF7]
MEKQENGFLSRSRFPVIRYQKRNKIATSSINKTSTISMFRFTAVSPSSEISNMEHSGIPHYMRLVPQMIVRKVTDDPPIL